jgi:hypothetical protein
LGASKLSVIDFKGVVMALLQGLYASRINVKAKH